MIKCPRKSEIAVTIDSNYLYELKDQLKINSSSEVARVAFTLLDWMSQEVCSGRIIVSVDENGKNIHRLKYPELERVSINTRN